MNSEPSIGCALGCFLLVLLINLAVWLGGIATAAYVVKLVFTHS